MSCSCTHFKINWKTNFLINTYPTVFSHNTCISCSFHTKQEKCRDTRTYIPPNPMICRASNVSRQINYAHYSRRFLYVTDGLLDRSLIHCFRTRFLAESLPSSPQKQKIKNKKLQKTKQRTNMTQAVAITLFLYSVFPFDSCSVSLPNASPLDFVSFIYLNLLCVVLLSLGLDLSWLCSCFIPFCLIRIGSRLSLSQLAHSEIAYCANTSHSRKCCCTDASCLALMFT